MKDFVLYILRALAEHPDRVQATEIYGKTNVIVEVRCHPDDMGRIIGKNGKTISALRLLLSGLAAKHKRKVVLEVVE